MKALSERLPSWEQVFLLFIAVSFPINLWAMINFLRVLPSFLLRLKWAEIILVGSYTQTFALLESLSILMLLLFIGILLPGIFLHNRWVAKGVILIWMTSIWVASFHTFPYLFPFFKQFIIFVFRLINSSITEETQILVGIGLFLTIWVSLYFQIILTSYHRLRQGDELNGLINRILDRISVLALIYIVVDLIGLFAVFIHMLV